MKLCIEIDRHQRFNILYKKKAINFEFNNETHTGTDTEQKHIVN